jgi:hypothetical protein
MSKDAGKPDPAQACGRKTLTPVSQFSAAGPRALADLMDRGRLADLAGEARRRQGLTERVRLKLPQEAAAHLVTASLSTDGVLVLTMDASVWAARIRFEALEFAGGRRVRVRVQPPQSNQPGTT